MFCHMIPGHEMAQGTFSVLRGYIDEKTIPWDRMVGFRTDGAPSMAGRRVGLCTLDMNVSPSAIYILPLYDTSRATGGKRAEHRTLRYTAAGNFDCKLHQTTSTACTPVHKTMWRYGIGLGGYRGAVLE